MSLARSALLRASRSPWLADQFRRRAFARRAVRRFMPGEDLESALGAARTFADVGIGSVLTNLGERVTTATEADAVRAHYAGVLTTLRERNLPAHVSVKLTHLGLDADQERCARSVADLAACAAESGSFLWIDMEESHYVDRTIEIFRRVRLSHRAVGLCLQAYLHRTPADLDTLLTDGAAIRLVKGAYREPPDVAIPRKTDVDAVYLTLAGRLLDRAATGGATPAFGTHDLAILERLARLAAGSAGGSAAAPAADRAGPGTPPPFEVHMLYGIKAAEQRRIAASGTPVRVLISYGAQWFPWYMRRLAERPANVWFVVRNLVS